MPFWLRKENIFNFWIPRFLVCTLIYFVYDNSQLSLDPKRLYYGNPSVISDFYKYSIHFKFNPLFSLVLQQMFQVCFRQEMLRQTLFHRRLVQFIKGVCHMLSKGKMSTRSPEVAHCSVWYGGDWPH